MAPGADQTEADRRVIGADTGVGEGTAGCGHIAGISQTAIYAKRQRSQWPGQRQAAGQTAINAFALPERGAAQGGRARARYGIAHHIDNASQGIRAIKQRLRATDDLDALRRHGLNGHRVIRRRCR